MKAWYPAAMTLTRVSVAGFVNVPTPRCALADKRTAGVVPVLSPLKNATRDDIERTADDPETVQRAVPPGAQWLYAVRPPRPAARECRRVPAYQPDCHLMRFALDWNVTPDPRVIVRLTFRFRGAVLRELLKLKNGNPTAPVTGPIRLGHSSSFGLGLFRPVQEQHQP